MHRFHERGYAATTVSDIVEGTGYSPGAFYFHFDNKADCFWHAVAYREGLRGPWWELVLEGLDPASAGLEAVLAHLRPRRRAVSAGRERCRVRERVRITIAVTAALAASALLAAPGAPAAFPGADGSIAFTHDPGTPGSVSDILAIDPTGSSRSPAQATTRPSIPRSRPTGSGSPSTAPTGQPASPRSGS